MSRVTLFVDAQKRMSVGKLGFDEGHAVADPLPDGSGWVVRPAKLLTQAEIDVLSRLDNVEDVKRGLADLAEGRLTDRSRH
jgi:hypothetical protein